MIITVIHSKVNNTRCNVYKLIYVFIVNKLTAISCQLSKFTVNMFVRFSTVIAFSWKPRQLSQGTKEETALLSQTHGRGEFAH